MHIKQFLGEDVFYYPVDCVNRFPETIVCDFNKYHFPEQKVDVIVCAGILGYINDPEWFLDQVTISCRKLFLSYQGREKFDFAMLYTGEIIDYLYRRGFELTKQETTLNDMWTLVACFEKVHEENYCNLEKKVEMVCFGAGDCFRRNYRWIKEFYDIKLVCDNDVCKWGQEIVEGVRCISPKELKEIKHTDVIITVDNIVPAFSIVSQLQEMQITSFDYIENWLAQVRQQGYFNYARKKNALFRKQ